MLQKNYPHALATETNQCRDQTNRLDIKKNVMQLIMERKLKYVGILAGWMTTG